MRPQNTLTYSGWLATTRADKTDTVAIGVLYIYFSVAPGLVNRPGINPHTLLDKFRVQRIHILNDQVDHATRNPIPRKRRHVQPHTIARHTHVTGIWFRVIHTMREFPPKPQPPAIELLRRSGATNMDERNRNLQKSKQKKRKTHLTHTGLLMEEVSELGSDRLRKLGF